MANSEETERQIAAGRLAHILEEHGIVRPQKHGIAYILIGALIGCSIGLFIGGSEPSNGRSLSSLARSSCSWPRDCSSLAWARSSSRPSTRRISR
jgi:hypothetical protein